MKVSMEARLKELGIAKFEGKPSAIKKLIAASYQDRSNTLVYSEAYNKVVTLEAALVRIGCMAV